MLIVCSKLLKRRKHLIFMILRKRHFRGTHNTETKHMDPHFYLLFFFKSNDPNMREKNFFFNFQLMLKSSSGVFNILNTT